MNLLVFQCFGREIQVIRDYTPDPEASWRNGKPDYLLVPWIFSATKINFSDIFQILKGSFLFGLGFSYIFFLILGKVVCPVNHVVFNRGIWDVVGPEVNRTFFDHRSLEHEVGSLEAVVSKLIKNWDPWMIGDDLVMIWLVD